MSTAVVAADLGLPARLVPWPAARSTTLARCVLLALLLHLAMVLWLGTAPEGSAPPGEGRYGRINVTLAGPLEDGVARAPPPQAGTAPATAAARFGGSVREAPAAQSEPGASQLAPQASLLTVPTVPMTAPGQPSIPEPSALTAPALPESPALAEPAEAIATLRAPPSPRAGPALAPFQAAPTPAVPGLAALPDLAELPSLAAPAARLAANPPATPEPVLPRAPPTAPLTVPPTAPQAAEAPPLPRLATPPLPAAAAPRPALVAPALGEASPLAVPALPPAAPLQAVELAAPPTRQLAPEAPLAAPSPSPAPLRSPDEPVARHPEAGLPTAPALSSALSPAPTPASLPAPAPSAAPAAVGSAASAGPQLGADVAVPATAASAPRPLNLELGRLRGGELSRLAGPGALPVLPKPPETDKLAREIEKTVRPDCAKAYAGAGLLAVVPLAIDTVRGSGCKW